MTRIIDLTHPLWDEMAVYPGLPQPSFTPIARVEADGSQQQRCFVGGDRLAEELGDS